jgi:hypothetical protein
VTATPLAIADWSLVMKEFDLGSTGELPAGEVLTSAAPLFEEEGDL